MQTFLFILSLICIHRRQLFSPFENEVFETLKDSVETQLGKYAFIAAYLPFQCSGQRVNLFQTDLQYVKKIVIGDCNAKHRKAILTAEYYLMSAFQDIFQFNTLVALLFFLLETLLRLIWS